MQTAPEHLHLAEPEHPALTGENDEQEPPCGGALDVDDGADAARRAKRRMELCVGRG
jgi:hypothetical protein